MTRFTIAEASYPALNKYATENITAFTEESSLFVQAESNVDESLTIHEETEPEVSINILQPPNHDNGNKLMVSQLENFILSLDNFTSFLLSSENSVFSDQHGNVWQDMSYPLSEYYISSSHNTYLVGHQLVGTSTIEGYIRALLRGCRSVECTVFSLQYS